MRFGVPWNQHNKKEEFQGSGKRTRDRQVTKKSVCVSVGMLECLCVPSPVLIAHATNRKGIQTEVVGGGQPGLGVKRGGGALTH